MHSGENENRRLGGIFLIICWVIVLGLISLLVHRFMYAPKAAEVLQTGRGVQLLLHRDYDSHFRVDGQVNGIPVNFLLDTGATTTVVSEQIAKEANLVGNVEIGLETANGQTTGYMTKIAELKIGPLVLKNVGAIIVNNLDSDKALLGMNVLKRFSLEQTGDTLRVTEIEP